jgi:putative phosphoribosyl transferase
VTAAVPRPVAVRIEPFGLEGTLETPAAANGLVLFAHGSGSSRHSPRNRRVAAALHARRMATLLFDLLTEREEASRENVFDIELLAGRLLAATRWALRSEYGASLPIGYFGASTGAAAALVAAARAPADVHAIVSRGGRPDLAGAALEQVRAPTLLIVGGRDHPVLEWNQDALARMRCEKQIAVVEGATHLFEEPGALQRVSELAGDWYEKHLTRGERT